MRQVTHALLTRPPLSHKIFISEENQIKCFVRLACVKHAASVHPEPGSNSHVKVCHLSMSCPVFKLAYQFPFACPLIYCFKVVSFIKKRSCAVVTAPWNSLNLSRLFHYLIIKVLFCLLLFRSSDSLFTISLSNSFVNNFFIFEKVFFRWLPGNSIPVCHLLSFSTRQLNYINISSFVCQQLFQKKIEQIIFSNKAEKEGFEPSRRLPDLYP